MMILRLFFLCFLVGMFACQPTSTATDTHAVSVANPTVSHVLTSGDSPAATIDQVSWIAGHWIGEAFGGTAEEIWSEPAGGAMMCVFRLVAEGEVQFYEIEQIVEVDGSLLLRLKHFHADLKGWEEKDETVDFPLLKLEGQTAYFEGMTFERVSATQMDVYVRIGQEDGTAEEVKFSYLKKDS